MSCMYATNLEDFILDTSPVAWFHGHSHDAMDYRIGNTRVTSNPRGYLGHEAQAMSWQWKVIKI